MLVMGLAPSLWLNTIRTGVHPPPSVELHSSASPVPQTSLILSGGRKAAAVEGPAICF